MKLKSVRDLDVCGRVVFLRSDLNSDIVDGRVLKGERIRESIKTIELLKKKGAKVVILAHQGNPGKRDFYGLYQHARYLGRRVKFVDDVVGEKALWEIGKLKNGEAILLDNVRFVDDEFNPKKKGNIFARNFLPLCDVYVNDAFSVSHRDHFSITGFSKVKEKCVGLLAEKEIRALEKVSMKGAVYVLGGAKGETNIKLLGRGNKVIASGLFGQACLASEGFEFGYQDEFLRKTVLIKNQVGVKQGARGGKKLDGYDLFLRSLKRKLDRVITPVDFAVEVGGKRKEFLLKDFPREERIEDLGEKSIEKFCSIIRRAKSVYVKGPSGWAEDKRFSRGTVEILKAVSEAKFSLVGGGQLSEVINKNRVLRKRKFGHVSLSGGACLSYVSGEKLVGLKALGYYS